MTPLVHITSLESAISIILSGRYHPFQSHPTLTDSGLNAFIVDSIPNLRQEFGGVGARLLLNWNGPVEKRNNFPLPPNVLCTDMPWRVVVPLGTTEHLTLAGLDASDEEWRNLDVDLPLLFRLPLLDRFGKGQLRKKVEARIAGGHPITVMTQKHHRRR